MRQLNNFGLFISTFNRPWSLDLLRVLEVSMPHDGFYPEPDPIKILSALTYSMLVLKHSVCVIMITRLETANQYNLKCKGNSAEFSFTSEVSEANFTK